MRINKYISECGVASRRGADALIMAGRVVLNGATVTEPGVQVDPSTDVVLVDNQRIAPLREQVAGKEITIMLHKPVQVVTTASDPQGRQTVFDILPADFKKLRLLHVGRLDYFSEGLLLLTTDGELCNRLVHPRWHLPKIYHVLVRGEIREEWLRRMRSGMTLAEGEVLEPVEVKMLRPEKTGALLEMTLLQGLNRQIRRMCRDCGLTVLKLVRVSQGPIQLGGLKAGESRMLSAREIESLRQCVDL